MQIQSQQILFEKYIQEVATATLQNGGVAFKLDTCQFLPPMDVWEFPKYPSKTVILPPGVDLVNELRNFVSTNEPFLREPDCWLGTWVNPQTRCFYLDITTSCIDLDEARRMALEVSGRDGRKIVAIYNSRQRKIIYLREDNKGDV